jgi:hypothetical protein
MVLLFVLSMPLVLSLAKPLLPPLGKDWDGGQQNTTTSEVSSTELSIVPALSPIALKRFDGTAPTFGFTNHLLLTKENGQSQTPFLPPPFPQRGRKGGRKDA